MKILLFLLSVVLFTGCATPVQTKQRMAFPISIYEQLPKSGNSVVKGQAFLKTQGGDVKLAAGNEIILNPVTSYSEEWYREAYLNGVNIGAPDPRLFNYSRTVVADAEGRFEFSNVPSGKYFVTTIVVWKIPSQYGLRDTGGAVTKRITVTDGETLEVVVTR